MVLLKLKDKSRAPELIEQLKQGLTESPTVVYSEVGLNVVDREVNYDVAVLAVFKTVEDLNAFLVSPAHTARREAIKDLIEARHHVDYSL